MRRMVIAVIRVLPLVSVSASVLAAGLFWIQGGFGAGHLDYDFLIGVFGLPSILLGVVLTLLPYASQSDFVLVVLYPGVLNLLLWSSVYLMIGRRLSSGDR